MPNGTSCVQPFQTAPPCITLQFTTVSTWHTSLTNFILRILFCGRLATPQAAPRIDLLARLQRSRRSSMPSFYSLSRLLRLSHSSPTKPQSLRASYTRLYLEGLEDRTLLAHS